MTRDEAIQAAHNVSSIYGIRLGRSLFEYQHPRTRNWVFSFAMEEHRPAWCWLLSLDDSGNPLNCHAAKRPAHFLRAE